MKPAFFVTPGRYLAMLLLPLLLSGLAARAQAPAWQTAVVGNGNLSTITATAADASGNVYVAGFFQGTLALGDLAALTSAGSLDAFVAKWSPATSRFVWAQRAGGTGGNDAAYGVAVSGANVYVAGSFTGTAGFGATSLVSAGSDDVFVAKLTDAGPGASFAWAQRAGGTSHDAAYGVAVGGANVYVAGYFAGTAGFGATSLVSAGSNDAFVAKLTDAGPGASFVWAQRAGGTNDDRARGVAVGGANVYVVGYFAETADFGATSLAAVNGFGSSS
jgi:hypothetical protein